MSEYRGVAEESLPDTGFACFDAVMTLNAAAFGKCDAKTFRMIVRALVPYRDIFSINVEICGSHTHTGTRSKNRRKLLPMVWLSSSSCVMSHITRFNNKSDDGIGANSNDFMMHDMQCTLISISSNDVGSDCTAVVDEEVVLQPLSIFALLV